MHIQIRVDAFTSVHICVDVFFFCFLFFKYLCGCISICVDSADAIQRIHTQIYICVDAFLSVYIREKEICEIYDAFISVYICVCIRSIASVLSMEAVHDVVSVAACVAVCVAACVAACVAVCYSVLQCVAARCSVLSSC